MCSIDDFLLHAISKLKPQHSPQPDPNIEHIKQIYAKQICKLPKTNVITLRLQSTRGGFIPMSSVILLWPHCHFERMKCCFVAAVSCPSPLLLLCILFTVLHVEGEIKVKATSAGSCSGRTVHAKHHTIWIRKQVPCKPNM